MKKTFCSFIITVLLVLLGTTNVFAASKTCAKPGCNKKAWGKSSYCSTCNCAHSGCRNKRKSGSNYCYSHQLNSSSGTTYSSKKSGGKTSTGSSSSKKNTKNTSNHKSSKKNSSNDNGWDSYDAGYEDVWLDDDYDWDRYQNDSDYADGVDDAMEDWDW